MDSKTRVKAILMMSILVFVLLFTVVVADYAVKKQKREKAAAYHARQEASKQAESEANIPDEETNPYHLNPDKDPRAFMNDADFFEQEKPFIDPKTQLSLLVNSSSKDMRVYIVDGNGDIVKGQYFNVILSGGNKYKDIDKDGIIYIADLEPGDYSVSLEEKKGYVVPTDAVTTSVKEEISYTVLPDISYLIKTEDEIDAKAEDTAQNDAEQNADGTEDNRKLSREDAALGIDISKWNKEIDFERVKADGVEYVIIRCGYRGSKTGALVEDPYFKQNIEGATKAGLKVGIYFFTQAVNEVEGVEEASMVISLVRKYKIDYPLYIDTEGAGGNGRADGLDKENRTAAVKAFCETIENGGYNAGIYASKNWFEDNLKMDDLSGYHIWLAQYSSEPTYKGDYGMWQYTSAGSVDGINGRVDLNLSFMSY